MAFVEWRRAESEETRTERGSGERQPRPALWLLLDDPQFALRASMLPMSPSLHRAARRALLRWERTWGVSGLSESVDIAFSPRMTRTVGRAVPETGRISLNDVLREAPTGQVLEVLCHEVAHIVAVRQARAAGRPRPRAHGPEWSALVRAAGYTPSVRMRRTDAMAHARLSSASTQASNPTVDRGPAWFVHSCPVCQTERLSRRAVKAWRCAECVAAGLEGMLEITRRSVAAKA